jgi:hypothetical protein
LGQVLRDFSLSKKAFWPLQRLLPKTDSFKQRLQNGHVPSAALCNFAVQWAGLTAEALMAVF